ncbi:hypothetical protein NTD80_01930 [Pseudomonas sp. 13B_2.1_Bac1]|uniref:hypothetical protein n=1 Tax=Pseudomonas sp. 13B_2.1_Bac1 TaxID=2971624 RepID=UPI0021C9CC7A|nr:hypothetical protein [Pseudomonas sp. 13B_2.1_Bac1]MCU1781501.1 hypothetical protein [Pseudomonas sp. 13B_2.1_Bac1]
MQDKLLRPLLFNAVLWLCGITLLFTVRDIIGRFNAPIDDGLLDLALVLVAYVLLFLLEPIRCRISRHMRKRVQRRARRHTH